MEVLTGCFGVVIFGVSRHDELEGGGLSNKKALSSWTDLSVLIGNQND